jgi:hypothetical protein
LALNARARPRAVRAGLVVMTQIPPLMLASRTRGRSTWL